MDLVYTEIFQNSNVWPAFAHMPLLEAQHSCVRIILGSENISNIGFVVSGLSL